MSQYWYTVSENDPYILFILLNRDADGAGIKGKGGTAAYTFPWGKGCGNVQVAGKWER